MRSYCLTNLVALPRVLVSTNLAGHLFDSCLVLIQTWMVPMLRQAEQKWVLLFEARPAGFYGRGGEICKAPCNGGACAQVVDNMCRRPGTERSCLNWFVTWSVATILSAYSSGWYIRSLAIKYWIAMMNMLPPM